MTMAIQPKCRLARNGDDYVVKCGARTVARLVKRHQEGYYATYYFGYTPAKRLGSPENLLVSTEADLRRWVGEFQWEFKNDESA